MRCSPRDIRRRSDNVLSRYIARTRSFANSCRSIRLIRLVRCLVGSNKVSRRACRPTKCPIVQPRSLSRQIASTSRRDAGSLQPRQLMLKRRMQLLKFNHQRTSLWRPHDERPLCLIRRCPRKHGCSDHACQTCRYVQQSPDDRTGEARQSSRRTGEQRLREVPCPEIQAWKNTPHATTFDQLHRRPEAKSIAKKLELNLIKHTGRCVACHSTQQTNVSGNIHTIAGVSCESCHVAAKDWLDIDDDHGGEGITRLTESPRTVSNGSGTASRRGYEIPRTSTPLPRAVFDVIPQRVRSSSTSVVTRPTASTSNLYSGAKVWFVTTLFEVMESPMKRARPNDCESCL